MNIADAFAPIEARYRAEVQARTFGHLAPKKNKTYKGFVIFAIGCFGSAPLNPTALECDFGDLGSSPWFYDALSDFIGEYGGCDASGKVFRFDGSFRNYEFKGAVRELKLL